MPTTDRHQTVRLVECDHGSEFPTCPVDGCTHAGGGRDRVGHVQAGPVPASHWATCQACRRQIRPDDPIVKVNDRWVHEEDA